MKNLAETVRNSADIVRVVSDYVTLKGTGATLKGLCPFHSEKTPSFSVHRDKQYFYCFGCGAGGDVFSFVMTLEKATFPESVRIVAEKLGISIPEQGVDDGKADERKELFDALDRASNYFRKMLSGEEAGPARQILEKRKISAEFAERFRVGYAPASGLLATLRPRDAVATGLFLRNEQGEVYDRFRRRLMFPIWNDRGKVIAFGGRAIGDVQPKYLNSSESPLYSKSNVLYALHVARNVAQKAGRMVVVEGYFDCLSLHQGGIENVVASCGTSLTQQQVAIMARYVPEIVMNYDPDTAGQNAMRRSIDLLLAKNLRVRILKLPGGLDPDDFIRREGGEVYSRLIADAPYFWQYLMTEAARQHDLDQPSAKADAVRDVLQCVAKIQDRVEQLEVARAVAEGFKVPEALVFESLHVSPRRPEVRPAVPKAAVTVRRTLSPSEKQLIHAVLQDPELGRQLEPFVDFLVEAWSRPILEQLFKDPARNLEVVLESVEDEELRSEVRAAVMEPFTQVSLEQALASVAQLRDAYLVKREKEIREQLKQCGSGAAPLELMKMQMDIARMKGLSLEKTR